MSIPLKIEYGVPNKKINITSLVIRQNTSYYRTGLLFIPKDDIYRAKLFSDPVHGVKKFMMINLNGKKYILNDLHDIFIDLNTQIIYLDSMIVPEYIEEAFSVSDRSKLYSIHKHIRLPYHSLVDELPEQLMTISNITGNEKVLEIGSNIGRNTFVIAHLLNKMNNNNFVTLESNTSIYNELIQNKKLNSFNFIAENAALSKRKLIQNHWQTIPSETVLSGWKNVNVIDFDTLQKKHNIIFDTLVLDCEGAFYYILMDMPNILDNIKMLIMENDYRNIEHYKYVYDELIKNNFEVTLRQSGGNSSFPTQGNFYEVWKKLEKENTNNIPSVESSESIVSNDSSIIIGDTKYEQEIDIIKEENEEENKVPENYYNTLDKYYDNIEKKEIIQPFDSLKSRRANVPLDLQTLKELLKYRMPNVTSSGFKSILNKRNLELDFKQDEYTPVVVNSVFTEEALKLIQHYFHDTINNKKFAFGDNQSQRFREHNDLMSRVMQYEVLPLIEKITKKKLKPTYTYLSCYVKGSDLPAHTDRSECEFTVSFLIDKPEGCTWPIYIDKQKEPVKNRGRYTEYVNSENIHKCIQVDCDTGGLMCFQGTDHIHFREKLEYDYYYISLLHYEVINDSSIITGDTIYEEEIDLIEEENEEEDLNKFNKTFTEVSVEEIKKEVEENIEFEILEKNTEDVKTKSSKKKRGRPKKNI